MSICKGKNKSGNPCKFKAKEGEEGYCKRCMDCGKGFNGKTKTCEICKNKRKMKKKLKISAKKKCSFEGCKYQAQKDEDFCGKHLKISKKLQNPDIYCTRKNCYLIILKYTYSKIFNLGGKIYKNIQNILNLTI